MAKRNSNKSAKSPAKGRTNKKKYTIFVTHSGKEMRFEDAVKASDYEIQMADSIKQTLTFDTKKAFNEYKTQKIEEAAPPRGNNKLLTQEEEKLRQKIKKTRESLAE